MLTSPIYKRVRNGLTHDGHGDAGGIEDGTRNHDMYDGANVLVIPGSNTAGFKDIQLRERNGKWRKTYRWSEKAKAYRAD